MTAAHAGIYAEVGDQFRRDDGTLLVVAKLIVHSDTNTLLVCLYKRNARSKACTWANAANLHGDWVTYAGAPYVSVPLPQRNAPSRAAFTEER